MAKIPHLRLEHSSAITSEWYQGGYMHLLYIVCSSDWIQRNFIKNTAFNLIH